MIKKLSATAISTYLKNRRIFYFHYVFTHPDFPNTIGIIPSDKSQDRYDGDLVFGDVWAKFTHRFYGGMGQEENVALSIAELEKGFAGWLLPKDKKNYLEAFGNLSAYYYRTFNPSDRLLSEVTMETPLFTARLDGMMADVSSQERIIHECKATKRGSSLGEQLKGLEQSIQSRLYAVITKAKGIQFELAYKDSPHVVFRAPVYEYDTKQVEQWEDEFIILRREMLNAYVFPCNFSACNYASKYKATICPYRSLCEGSTDYSGFIPRTQLTTRGEVNGSSDPSSSTQSSLGQ